MEKVIKNILLPTDFSNNAQSAVQFAAMLFAGQAYKFHLLNVYGVPDSVSYVSYSIKKILAEQSEMSLNNEIENLEVNLPENAPKIEMHSAYGSIIEIVRKVVQEKEIDLIIMGTKGVSNLKDTIFGQNVQKILKEIECSVLAIPEIPYPFPQKIGLAISKEFHVPSQRIERFFNISQIKSSQIEFITMLAQDKKVIIGEPTLNYPGKEYWLSEKETELHSFERSIQQIKKQIEPKQLDLLGFIGKEYSFFEHLIHKKSALQNILIHANIPILVFKYGQYV